MLKNYLQFDLGDTYHLLHYNLELSYIRRAVLDTDHMGGRLGTVPNAGRLKLLGTLGKLEVQLPILKYINLVVHKEFDLRESRAE